MIISLSPRPPRYAMACSVKSRASVGAYSCKHVTVATTVRHLPVVCRIFPTISGFCAAWIAYAARPSLVNRWHQRWIRVSSPPHRRALRAALDRAILGSARVKKKLHRREIVVVRRQKASRV